MKTCGRGRGPALEQGKEFLAELAAWEASLHTPPTLPFVGNTHESFPFGKMKMKENKIHSRARPMHLRAEALGQTASQPMAMPHSDIINFF